MNNFFGNIKIFFKVVAFSFCFFVGVYFFTAPSPISAQDESQQLEEKKKQIEELEKKLDETADKKVTLESTLEKIGTKISLTQTNIQKTQLELNTLNAQIAELNSTIAELEESLDAHSIELINTLRESYKIRQAQTIEMLILSEGLSELMLKYKYLQLTQSYTQKLLAQVETQRMDYDRQKMLKEVKQQEVESKKLDLAHQQAQLLSEQNSQSNLLQQTKNDEQQFQKLLAQARAEYESIQAIIRGQGDESEAGEVKTGDKIASIISGASCNSSGTHLHFTVTDSDGNTRNPFDYLKPVDHTNCSGREGGKCSPSDPFEPKGNWDWPVSTPIYMSQGYGKTWSITHDWVGEIYSSHNGIDITGGSLDVKAVQDGTLFRGSYTGSNNCKLPYVRVRHKDGLNSFYLHVNY